jgi:lysophospholipase L1-like esterase
MIERVSAARELRGWKRKRLELGLVCTGIALTCLGFEFAAHVWLYHLAGPELYHQYALYTEIPPRDFRLQPHHYLAYALTPNYHAGKTFHNSLGYRAGEFPRAKPPGEFRIVAVGGSTTYDEFIEDNEAIHTAQLEAILHARGYSRVRVINAGVPSYNSWESLINLQFRVLDLDPDIVIHYDNNNDAHARLVPPAVYAGDDSAGRQPWTPPAIPWHEHSAFLRILSRYLHYTRQVGVEDFVVGPYLFVRMNSKAKIAGNPLEVLARNPPVYFERNVRNMITLEKDHGVVPVLVTYAYSESFPKDYTRTPYYQKAFAEHNAIYRRLAVIYKVPLCDLAAVMPTDREYFVDGRHTSAKGARKRAEIYAECLVSQHVLPSKPTRGAVSAHRLRRASAS